MGKMIEMEKTVETNHTFAVCAYKESPYLKECLESLVNQTVKTNIIIATSTPNEYIDKLAEKYGIKVYVNKGLELCIYVCRYGICYDNASG